MKNKLIIAASLLIIACSGNKKQEEKKETLKNTVVKLTAEQLKNASIETGKIEKQEISTVLKLNGSIDVPPQNKISVSSPLGGYLKYTKLLPGMIVKKGESIAVMEDVQFIQIQQDYLLAKSKLELAQAEFKRQEELNATKSTSDKQFQMAKNEFETERILVKSLSEKLLLVGINPTYVNENNISRKINIFSPIDGFVSKVNVNIGKYTSPSDVLFELVNIQDIHLNLSVFEKDINTLSIGQLVSTYSVDNPDKKYQAKIILIGKEFGANRATEVNCHFEQYDQKLLPGMYMSAEVNVKSKDALVVPNDAIVSWENKQYVFIEIGTNEFEMTPVSLGLKSESTTEIILGKEVNSGAVNVVLKNAYTLLMQLKNKNEE